MMDDPQKQIDLLRTTIEVLEQENSQLSERAEDAMLLGLVAEAIQGIQDPHEVMLQVLERISILKDFPFVTCGKISGSSLDKIASYSLFTDNENEGYPIEVQPDIHDELRDGPTIDRRLQNIRVHFSDTSFAPSSAVIIPFSCRDFGPSLLLLFDRENSNNELGPSLFLLDQIVNMAVSYIDNLYLSRELDLANANLENRIQQKTADLTLANQKLLESHNRFTAVLDGIDAYVYVVNLETYEVLYLNRKCETEISATHIGSICYKALKDRSYPCNDCNIPGLLEHVDDPDYVVVTEAWEPSLSTWLLNREKIISWPDVRLAKLTIATDVSDLKKAEDERNKMQQNLQQAQKMEAVGILAGSVAHDLNNILSGIVSYPDLLLDSIAENEPMRKPLETIKSAGEKAAAIVRDLLTLARRGVKEDNPVDFGQIVKDYIESAECKNLLRDNERVQIIEPVDYESYIVNGSAPHLANVVMNLVTNAAEAMPNGGTITIQTDAITLTTQPPGFKGWRPGPYVRLIVKDNGSGISESAQQRVFEPFYSDKKLDRSGTGLGLAIVWGTVVDHNGFVTLESEHRIGTSFQVLLPLVDSDIPVVADIKAQELVKGSGQSILVVDDVENQRQIASDILLHLGYSVATVDSGEQAIEYLKESSADIVLLDMIMSPGIDGLETYKRIIEIQPSQTVIIVSGYSRADKIEEAKKLGISQFVAKPYSMVKISAAVEQAIRSAEKPAT